MEYAITVKRSPSPGYGGLTELMHLIMRQTTTWSCICHGREGGVAAGSGPSMLTLIDVQGDAKTLRAILACQVHGTVFQHS
jgi:hypothetical protein